MKPRWQHACGLSCPPPPVEFLSPFVRVWHFAGIGTLALTDIVDSADLQLLWLFHPLLFCSLFIIWLDAFGMMKFLLWNFEGRHVPFGNSKHVIF